MINQKTIFENINREIGKVISGKENVIKMIATAILAGGHVLLEDVPGVGKTTLALAFSKAFDLSYRRMQFTPDVLPSDVIGFSMYNKKTDEFIEVELGEHFATIKKMLIKEFGKDKVNNEKYHNEMDKYINENLIIKNLNNKLK